MINDVIKEAEHKMKGAIHALEEDLHSIRTGRANPAIVEKVTVDYYGTPTPLKNIASITVPEALMLIIKPFDKASLKSIEKAILASELGLTPQSDGAIIRLNFPPLTQERRKDLVRQMHHRLEECRIAIRNVRRNAIDELREFKKEKLISEDEEAEGEEGTQKLTDKYVNEVEMIGKRKEAEIMTV